VVEQAIEAVQETAEHAIDAPEVVEQAIEAVQETAEHAIDALVEVHQQEEETERAEVMADAIEAIAEAEPEPEPEPIAVLPPQPEDGHEAPRAGRRAEVSRFRSRRMGGR
jgi:hypothetical protein